LDEVATIAAPATLLTWHRNLIGRHHVKGASRIAGRPPTRQDIAALVVRMAEENRSWGYRRIQGALSNLNHHLSHNTIRNILKRQGIEPSPERARRTTWTEFLEIHWQQIVASNFFRASSKKSGFVSLIVLCL
jgi:putative transposase